MIRLRHNILLTLIAASASMNAELRLPEIIGDNMVVQQKSGIRLWGTSDPGSEVSITASWNPSQSVTTRTDASTGKWQAEIASCEATFTPQKIVIRSGNEEKEISNVLVGEVWFCSGQSNMEMPLRGFWTQPVEGAKEAIAYSGSYPGIRVAKVPKKISYEVQDDVESGWKTSNPKNARDFSALAYFFAESLTKILNVPVGIIDCSYGGSKVEGWQSRRYLDTYPEIDVDKEKNDSTLGDWERVNVMYNAMLHPVIGYTVKGFLWNQGESNVGRESTYPTHLKDMVAEWRDSWGLGELPFYFVEIPGWNYGDPDGTNAAEFRECQHLAARLIPNSGIVGTADLVYPHEVNDIHASKKKEIGERLAYLAAGNTYGIEGMPTEYPSFREMEVTEGGKKAILKFDNAWEGFTPNTELEGFEAAGDDGIFHTATAKENPQTLNIEIECGDIDNIKDVRYNFRNFRVGKVFNVLGLPLIPFRTDSGRK